MYEHRHALDEQVVTTDYATGLEDRLARLLRNGDCGHPFPVPSGVPFAHLYAAIVAASRQEVLRRRPAIGNWPRAILDGLARRLYEVLSFRTAEAIHLQFHLFRLARISRLQLLAWRGRDDAPDDVYRAFIATNEVRELHESQPGFAQRTLDACRDWIATSVEFFDRLERDWKDLRTQFDIASRNSVVGVSSGWSDPHDGGRTVVRLALQDGTRLYYKPRDVRLEAAFQRLVTELVATGLPFGPRPVQIATRTNYGWSRGVAPRASRNIAAHRTLQLHTGGLLALMMALHGIDGHHENVVACNDRPALVDAECLLHPVALEDLRQDRSSSGVRNAPGTIGGTGLLPGSTMAQSPFDAKVAGWTAINTDAMDLAHRSVAGWDSGFAGRNADRSLIGQGFSATYRFLMKNRRRVIDLVGANFATTDVRFVARPTIVYQQALVRAATARGVARGDVEWFPRAPGSLPDALRLLIDYERSALRRFDVPRFSVSASATAVQLASGEHVTAFRRSGLDDAIDSLEALDSGRLAAAMDVITSSCPAT